MRSGKQEKALTRACGTLGANCRLQWTHDKTRGSRSEHAGGRMSETVTSFVLTTLGWPLGSLVGGFFHLVHTTTWH